MATSFPADHLDQVGAVLTAWEQIDPNLKLGDLTLAEAKAKLTAARETDQKVEQLNLQRTAAIDSRNTQFLDLRDMVSRLRSLVRAVHGPDSSEYNQVGGTRTSERKPRAKKGGAASTS